MPFCVPLFTFNVPVVSGRYVHSIQAVVGRYVYCVRGIAWQPWCVYFCFVLLLIFRCVHSAVAPGESRFRPHCNGALVMGINAKLKHDINSPDFYYSVGMGCCRPNVLPQPE